jgi:predicted DNA-binding transcriptional regulator AlpA
MHDERLLVDWKKLKELGWPYSRMHTYRLIAQGKFPQPKKFGNHPGARVAWRWPEVRPYFE